MNIILISRNNINRTPEGALEVHLCTSKASHVIDILRADVGSSVRVGVINGAIGQATITKLEKKPRGVTLQLDSGPLATSNESGDTLKQWTRISAPRPIIDVVLCIPRPKVFSRVLQSMAALGVGRIFLVCSARSDKSYLSSPRLRSAAIYDALVEGLEQAAVDTVLPEVYVYASWKRAIAELSRRGFLHPTMKRLVAHPYAEEMKTATWHSDVAAAGLAGHEGAAILAIGPEGGFIPKEIEDLVGLGFEAVGMGDRILKVDVALQCLHCLVSHYLTSPTVRRNLLPACRRDGLSPALSQFYAGGVGAERGSEDEKGGNDQTMPKRRLSEASLDCSELECIIQLPERDWKAQLERLKPDWDVSRKKETPVNS